MSLNPWFNLILFFFGEGNVTTALLDEGIRRGGADHCGEPKEAACGAGLRCVWVYSKGQELPFEGPAQLREPVPGLGEDHRQAPNGIIGHACRNEKLQEVTGTATQLSQASALSEFLNSIPDIILMGNGKQKDGPPFTIGASMRLDTPVDSMSGPSRSGYHDRSPMSGSCVMVTSSDWSLTNPRHYRKKRAENRLRQAVVSLSRSPEPLDPAGSRGPRRICPGRRTLRPVRRCGYTSCR